MIRFLRPPTSRLSTCFALAVALTTTASRAQDTPPAKGSQTVLEEVTVVGSRIRSLNVAPSSPVRVFDKAEIDQSGAATLQQFLEKLPQNFGGGANAGNVANSGVDRDVGVNDGRGSSINLRGLGTGTTLTLLNGQRIAGSNQFQYVDVSLIPVSAIERIEVMSDGASAIYGADAIGGVVNIVLRKDFDGYETTARYGSVTEGGLNEFQASLTGGWTWNGGNALVSYEYLEQDNLESTDRSFARNAPGQYDLYPRSTRNSVHGALSQQLTPSLVLDISGIYSKRDVRAFRGTTTDFETNVPNTEQYDLAASLKYSFPGKWEARLSAAFGQSDVLNTGFRTANSGSISPSSRFRIVSDAQYVDLAADGPLLSLPWGQVSAAFGATHRREEYVRNATSGTTPLPTTSAERNTTSVFGEIVVPLVGEPNRLPGITNLNLTAAVRHDHFDDFGSTTNPKFGMTWEVTPGLVVRGTYGESFRAPLFQDLVTTPASVVVLSVADPTSPTGRTLLMSAQGGNASLGPETATTWTAGLELQPDWLPRFSMKVSYFNIQYTDRIDRGFSGNFTTIFLQNAAPFSSILTRNPSQTLINEFRSVGQTGGSQFLVVRAGPFAVPAGQDERNTQVILDNRLRNNAAIYQDGIDFEANYGFDAGGNRIGFTIAGQHVLSGTRRVTPTSPLANTLNQSFLPVDFKLRMGATLSRAGWSAAAFLNYVDSYRDLANVADPRVESWQTVDLNIRYDMTGSAPEVLRGLSIALGVQNLFDKDPPFVITPSSSGFDPVNANPIGRFASLTVTKRW